jgi:alkanesulfonate monooxygenase SsuD/methylene tetrahydromethanopterin reductase-like flavin-dependent oxidoreductase (luciferase family)
LKFGIFDWLDGDPACAAERYDQRLRMVELADWLGFYAYHLAEHHGTPLGLAPSPNLLLAAAAAATHRLRLGPMVSVLPLYQPLRLIEELGMLDQLAIGAWSWASVASQQRRDGGNYVVGVFAFGAMATTDALMSMHHFARDVVPRISASPIA